MLRKISAYLSLVSLVAVMLAPAINVSAAARNGNSQRHVEKKAAPEFAKTNGSTASIRVLIQTKGAPTAAQDTALTSASGTKRASFGLRRMPLGFDPAVVRSMAGANGANGRGGACP